MEEERVTAFVLTAMFSK